ncbi:NAD(P)H-dependent oxidoreductase [Bacillaceae bacterium SIJ1]|uniref:NAD(P)H-dependent oxidoreductase n=1 Tax=Litoribacterium kuwaitense TaxID=1398745 RepID=UPI0013EE2275|nr:NAD(P)H-dependent oxidoreductase [Litoribacterium kuwaitense]NGP45718.1 NAD(P)H-dependent oxidoreductase [Litoribacterium kuwaitense]
MTSQQILIINGHPDTESFCSALARSYFKGAEAGGATVQLLELSQLDFNPNLSYGYRKRTELENDLLEAQRLIKWATHLVFVYPTWWGTMPAILKGFFDRTFLPGFAYQYRQKSPLWDKLLTGKTAHIIVTMDTPLWYERFVYKRAGLQLMKRNILNFCGMKPVGVTEISPMKGSSSEKRQRWLAKVGRLGEKQA